MNHLVRLRTCSSSLHGDGLRSRQSTGVSSCIVSGDVTEVEVAQAYQAASVVDGENDLSVSMSFGTNLEVAGVHDKFTIVFEDCHASSVLAGIVEAGEPILIDVQVCHRRKGEVNVVEHDLSHTQNTYPTVVEEAGLDLVDDCLRVPRRSSPGIVSMAALEENAATNADHVVLQVVLSWLVTRGGDALGQVVS